LPWDIVVVCVVVAVVVAVVDVGASVGLGVGTGVGDGVGLGLGDGDGAAVGASVYCEQAPGVVSRSASNSCWVVSSPVRHRLASVSQPHMNSGASVAEPEPEWQSREHWNARHGSVVGAAVGSGTVGAAEGCAVGS